MIFKKDLEIDIRQLKKKISTVKKEIKYLQEKYENYNIALKDMEEFTKKLN